MSHFFKSRGFTLIELLVSLGIMAVVLAVILTSQRGYSESAALANLADNLSLTLSQAQAYGIAVREVPADSGNSGIFTDAYGVSVSLLDSGSNKAYLFFVDKDNNQYHSDWVACGAGGECLERYDFPAGNYIDSFCVVRTSGSDQCGSVSRADITFKRPEPEARLKFFNSGSQEYTLPNTKGVKIILKSPGGLTRSVVVYTTGQISVQ